MRCSPPSSGGRVACSAVTCCSTSLCIDSAPYDRAIDTAVSRLRRKLAEADPAPLIETVRGAGLSLLARRALGMREAPSALPAICGFSVAVATLRVAATASVVLLMPDPPAVRVTVAEAAAAPRGATGSLERSALPPPDGAPAPLL